MADWKYRRIMCPVNEKGVVYKAMNRDTGEILECSNVATLLRRMAANPRTWWDWTFYEPDTIEKVK